jgi:hypothetical protein
LAEVQRDLEAHHRNLEANRRNLEANQRNLEAYQESIEGTPTLFNATFLAMRVETERIAEVIRSNKEKAVRSGSYKRDA